MIDIRKLSYETILTTADGERLVLNDVQEEMGWEESDGELAMQMNGDYYNSPFKGKHLSDFARLNCEITVRADWGGKPEVVFTGKIRKWNVIRDGAGKQIVSLTALDNLFNMQKSQHSYFFNAGTTTTLAIKTILDGWGIGIGRWDVPEHSHSKMVFNNQTIAEVLLKILEENRKKTGIRIFMRYNAETNAIDFFEHGSNPEIWHFEAGRNALSSNDELDTMDLVTKVRIVGKTDEEGRDVVEGIVTGKTEFGTIQVVENRDANTSLEKALIDANDLIQERGNPIRTLTVETVDVPTVRKGDKIYLTVSTIDDFCYVKSVRHNAKSRTMSMDVETKSMFYERPTIETNVERFAVSGFTPVPEDSNAAKIYNLLRAKGYTAQAAAGILGNIDRETGGTFDPTIIQGNGRGPGMGLCQWESAAMGGSGRWEMLVEWTAANGYDPLSIEGQIAYLDHEMTTTESYYMQLNAGVTGEEFKRMTDVDKATEAFLRGFERPADPTAGLALSIPSAQAFYEQWKDFDKVPEGGEGTGTFVWPVPGHTGISSGFGYRCYWNGYSQQCDNHLGIDIPAPNGTPVVAADGGLVIAPNGDWSYGNEITMDHGNGKKTRYAHLSGFAVAQGQTVAQGQIIGYVGSTGNSTGAHLHFEVMANGSHVNPSSYV